MTVKTSGREAEYRVSVDEAYPVLCLGGEESSGAAVVLPERLAKRFMAAEEELELASQEVARWVKYSTNEEAKAELRALIDALPTPAEAKARRKR